jgi:hypothetical protein
MMIMMIDRSDAIINRCSASLLVDTTNLLCSTIKRNPDSVGLNSLAPNPVFLSSGILSVLKHHQGLNIKRWVFRRSYKSLKTAVVLRPVTTITKKSVIFVPLYTLCGKVQNCTESFTVKKLVSAFIWRPISGKELLFLKYGSYF